MSASQKLLQSFPLLAQLSEEELRGAPILRVKRGAGERFFEEGSPGDAAYGVLEGRVQIAKATLDGKAFVLDVFGPGELVGAAGVLQGVPMPATATALEPSACVRIDGDWFRPRLRRHPQLASQILDVMMGRLLEAGASRLHLATSNVETRLAAVLLRMASKFGAERDGELVMERGFTRQNLADLAGTTVETTIRTMSRWSQEGWIESESGAIRIRAPEVLRKLSRA